MKTLGIDLETYSSVNLQKCGVYKYSQASDFEILLFAYSVDGNSVEVIDLALGETIPEEIIKALSDDAVTKTAHNSNFERVCLSRYLGLNGFLNPKAWHCTMIWSASLGLPLSLEQVGTVLGLDKQKITEGKDLIRYFCVPCNPTKTNGNRTRNLPNHDLDKWERFKSYNIRDVEVEMAIQEKLSRFPVPQELWEEYWLDQKINDRGIQVDMEFVKQAIHIDEISKVDLKGQLQDITGLENPNSPI